MIKAIIEEQRRDAFISCIEPAMVDFIQREVIERFRKEEKNTLFLAYGNFPGKERFFDLLYQALSVELEALGISNVESCQEIYDYMTHYVDASPENYHNKIIWFQIKSWDGYEAPLDTANFSPLYGENSYILRALQSLPDRTIGVVVTYECASTAMFTSLYDQFLFDYDWDDLFRTDRLWKIYTSSVCYTSMIADDIRNEMDGMEIKTVEGYYRKFQKKVLAYANYVLKRKRKREAKERRLGRIHEQNNYEYYSGHSIDRFLDLIKIVNDRISQGALDIEIKTDADDEATQSLMRSKEFQKAYDDTVTETYESGRSKTTTFNSDGSITITEQSADGSTGDTKTITFGGNATTNEIRSIPAAQAVYDDESYKEKLHTRALLAEAKLAGDPDYDAYVVNAHLQQELNEAFHDVGGVDCDGVTVV